VLADDPALTPAQQLRVARIERAAEEMTELITALLLLAREDDLAVHEPCDARQITQACVERYRPLADSRGTTLVLDTMADAVELVVPAALFTMVVANLVQNAVAHTRDGTIGVSLDREALTVRDTGSGIDSTVQARVFERYYRGPDSSGAGIGLSLVKRICDRLGWRIALQNNPTAGATATLRF